MSQEPTAPSKASTSTVRSMRLIARGVSWCSRSEGASPGNGDVAPRAADDGSEGENAHQLMALCLRGSTIPPILSLKPLHGDRGEGGTGPF